MADYKKVRLHCDRFTAVLISPIPLQQKEWIPPAVSAPPSLAGTGQGHPGRSQQAEARLADIRRRNPSSATSQAATRPSSTRVCFFHV